MLAVVIVGFGSFVALLIIAICYESSRQKALSERMVKWAKSSSLQPMEPPERTGWFSVSQLPIADEFLEPFLPKYGVRRANSRLGASGSYAGRTVTTFEYSYATGSGDSQNTVRRAVAAASVSVPNAKFMIRRQGLWDNIKALFGSEDIRCGDASFDNEFFLSGDQPTFVKALMTPETKALVRKNPGYLFQGIDGHVLVASVAEINADLAQQLLDCAVELAEQVELAVDHNHQHGKMNPLPKTDTTETLEPPVRFQLAAFDFDNRVCLVLNPLVFSSGVAALVAGIIRRDLSGPVVALILSSIYCLVFWSSVLSYRGRREELREIKNMDVPSQQDANGFKKLKWIAGIGFHYFIKLFSLVLLAGGAFLKFEGVIIDSLYVNIQIVAFTYLGIDAMLLSKKQLKLIRRYCLATEVPPR